MKLLYKSFLILLLVPSLLVASELNNDKKKEEKSKTIRKSFDVNSNATVQLTNKYGNLDITTWNKNTVEIVVEITVKGDDEDDVSDKLADINVDFESSKSVVSAKTRFGNSKSSGWKFWNRRNNISYKVHYIVKMPITNSVNLNNDYGSIALDKLKGEASINCDYGKIVIGDLMGKKSDINLDYCSSSTVASMNDANINIDYSKLNIGTVKTINVNADYSTVKIKEAADLTFNTDYGAVTADYANTVKGNGDYTSLRFGTITKSLKVNSDYGAIRIENLAKGFDFIDINSEYAGIRIGVESGTNFNFMIDLQYAGFSKDSNTEVLKSIVKSTKKYYEGFYGKANANSKLNINSQYGSVSIKEN